MLSLRPKYPSDEQAIMNRVHTQQKKDEFRKRRKVEFFETEPFGGITYEEYELFLLGVSYEQIYEYDLNKNEYEDEGEYYNFDYESGDEDEYMDEFYWN